MSTNTSKAANFRAIKFTINSLFQLALENADLISVRIEFSSNLNCLNVVVFSENTTHYPVQLGGDATLNELLIIEDILTDLVVEAKDAELAA